MKHFSKLQLSENKWKNYFNDIIFFSYPILNKFVTVIVCLSPTGIKLKNPSKFLGYIIHMQVVKQV